MYISEWKFWYALVSILAMVYCTAKGWYMKGYTDGWKRRGWGEKEYKQEFEKHEAGYPSWWVLNFFIGLTLFVVLGQE